MTTAMRPHLVSVPEDVDQALIAGSIAAMLDLRGVTQTELAKRISSTQTTISKSIKPKADGSFARRLQLPEAFAIARALGIPFDVLLLGSDEIRRRAMSGVLNANEAGPDDGPGLAVYPPRDSNPEPADYGSTPGRRLALVA